MGPIAGERRGWATPAIDQCSTLKVKIDGIGIWRLRGAARLDSDQFSLKLVREPRDDLVLHLEQVSDRLVEALRLEVRTRSGFDELDLTRIRAPPRCMLP